MSQRHYAGSMLVVPEQRTPKRPNLHLLVTIPEDDPDWRPSDHEFTDLEMRDRFMRYGGVDAATAWHLVHFVRDRGPVDWDRVIAASWLGHYGD